MLRRVITFLAARFTFRLRSWYFPLERQELRSIYWVLRSDYDPQIWGFSPCSGVITFLAVPITFRLRSLYFPLERQELRSVYWVLRSYYDPQIWGFPPCSGGTTFRAAALRSRYVPVTFLACPLRTAGITFHLLGFTFLLRSSDLGLSPMLRRDYVPRTPFGGI